MSESTANAVRLFSYWVLYNERLVHPTLDDGPLTDASRLAAMGEFATRPHVLDRNLVPALSVLWYVLHLPRANVDFLDVGASRLALAPHLDAASNIILIPLTLAGSPTVEHQRRRRPADLVFFDEGMDPSAISELFPDALGIYPFRDAQEEQLGAHWRLLATRVAEKDRSILEPPPFVGSCRGAPALIPTYMFARQMYASDRVDDSSDHRLRSAWMQRAQIGTLAAMEANDVPEQEVNSQYEHWLKATARSVRVNVVLGVPGVSGEYARATGSPSGFTYPGRDNCSQAPVSDDEIEAIAINSMVTHRAAARYGIGIAIPPVPEQCFRDLAELEDYSSQPTRSRPRVVRRLLGRIAEGLAPLFSDEDLLGVLRQCHTLTVFSNYPVGLAVLPGATSPLSCMFPISYRPLSPLSRTLIQEGIAPYVCTLGNPIKILVIECVDREDPIYALGRDAWPFLSTQVCADGFAELVIADASTPEEIAETILREAPSIVILSAHGFYDRARNVSGIIVGGRPVLGLELGPMPPLVVLSACHVSPRGVGTISIVDMLLRAGATAVLGTQIPVNAMSDHSLLGRFFTNLRAAATRELDLVTMQDVWQHVLATNAVYDVIRVSRRVHEWAWKSTFGERRLLVEFANHRSKGRLRSAHVYADTEEVLQELADETGFGETFRNTLRSEGYIPHTAFYYLAGWPERIVVGQWSPSAA